MAHLQTYGANAVAGIERALDLARRTGATTIARELASAAAAADHAAYAALILRLRHHLGERRYALSRSAAQNTARLSALRIVRSLGNSMIVEHARASDHYREHFTWWLQRERTKFVMSCKADALLAVDGAHENVVQLLTRFRNRCRHEVELSCRRLAGKLVVDVEHWLLELGETMIEDALAGLELVTLPAPPPVVVHWRPVRPLADRMFGTRRREQQLIREQVAVALADGSARIIERLIDDLDIARSKLLARFVELLDAWCESIETAGAAANAVDGGSEPIVRANQQIDVWLTELARVRVLAMQH